MAQTVGWRYVAGLLVAMGLLATSAVIGVVFWLTHRIDVLHQEATEAVVAVHLTKAQEQLTRFTEDYAHWTLAFEVVTANDAEAVYEHLGSGAVESDAFDEMFILDTRGHLAFAFASDTGLSPILLWTPRSVAPLLAALQETSPDSRQSQSAMVRLHGGLALVTAAWITPDTFAEPPDRPLPTLIGVKRLDQGWLSGLAASPYILAPEASLSPTPLSDNAQLFRGANGQIIGQIFWEVATPGHALRYDILPGLLVLCIGMLGMVISAARYFYGVSTHLVRATKIAMTDALTGLGNRAGLEAVLHTDPAKRAVAEGHIAVLYLDLDAFKPLNDTYGHHVGDIALKEIAARLQKAVRKSDIVVRLGGDEFVCVIFDTDPGAASHRVADRVIAFMQDPIVFPDHRQVIRVSIGLALGGPGIPWPMLLEQADVAMYRAKSRASHDPVQFTTDVPGAPQAA